MKNIIAGNLSTINNLNEKDDEYSFFRLKFLLNLIYQIIP